MLDSTVPDPYNISFKMQGLNYQNSSLALLNLASVKLDD